jgi:hypothetical protein
VQRSFRTLQAGFEGNGSFPKLQMDSLVKSPSDIAVLFEAIDIFADPLIPDKS